MTETVIDPSGKAYEYTVNPTGLTKLLKTMFLILLTIGVISVYSNYMQMNLLANDTISAYDVIANNIRQQAIGVSYIVAFIITAIVFLKWIYRANRNCHGFGAEKMTFLPWQTIAYYFIPIMNLYKPYQAMKEIWQVSTNPDRWQEENGNRLLGWWWALWLISGFIGEIFLILSRDAETIGALRVSTTVAILSCILDISSTLVAISLITTIYHKQEQLVNQRFN